jgi:hypothetical protein
MTRRLLILAYGTLSYALCLGALLYAVVFVTPTRLDGLRQGSVGAAPAVDPGLGLPSVSDSAGSKI